jgi:hypothetical protein
MDRLAQGIAIHLSGSTKRNLAKSVDLTMNIPRNGGQMYDDTKRPARCSDRASTRLYPGNRAFDPGDRGLRKYLAGSFHCLHYLNPAAS